MKLKDSSQARNIFDRVALSVEDMNKKIIAVNKGTMSSAELAALAACEQVSLMHELLVAVAILLIPEQEDTPPPIPTKRMLGFHAKD